MTNSGPDAELSSNFASLLPTFAQNTDAFTDIGYTWEATDITAEIGSMTPGEEGYVAYSTTVTSFSQYQSVDPNDVLIAYAGFGDPIGKAGGTGGIGDPNFPLLELSLPSFDPTTGDVSFGHLEGYAPALPLDSIDLDTSGVPEPAGWALMIVGVGAVGCVLRGGARRRREVVPGEA